MWSIVNSCHNPLSFLLCKRSVAKDKLLDAILVFTYPNCLFSKVNILHDMGYYSSIIDIIQNSVVEAKERVNCKPFSKRCAAACHAPVHTQLSMCINLARCKHMQYILIKLCLFCLIYFFSTIDAFVVRSPSL